MRQPTPAEQAAYEAAVAQRRAERAATPIDELVRQDLAAARTLRYPEHQ